MRPVGIVLSKGPEEVFAGVHQRYQRDDAHATRLDKIHLATLPALASWYGTAVIADELIGQGDLNGRTPPVGFGSWAVEKGALKLTSSGVASSDASARTLAYVALPLPAGIIAATLETGSTAGEQRIIFRQVDAANCWQLSLTAADLRLSKDHRRGRDCYCQEQTTQLTAQRPSSHLDS